MKLFRLAKSLFGAMMLGLMLAGFLLPRSAAESAPPRLSQAQCELVILASPDDPYYTLAEEITKSENASMFHSLREALACRPVYLIWVVSPSRLSDEAMIELGLALKEQKLAVSPGIITGSTIELARGLWERGSQVRAQRFFAANAPNESAHIYEGRITGFTAPQNTIRPLDIANFKDTLQNADYITFTGHGGGGYLRFDEETKFTAPDVPALDAVVVSTGSCQTLRPWKEDSIALQFIDRGAAAYSGFVYSPNEGYLLGEFDGLPFRYTWPEFPIGPAIQVQNRGTLQGFAYLPYHYLLGDPRIALQAEPPYKLVEDRQDKGQRILRYQDLPSGVVPIRVAGGAAYHFVDAVGITAAADEDPFYNSRLQMINIQDDKFILVTHPGGELTLQMKAQAPWHWLAADLVLDSLDHTYLFSQQSTGDFLAIIFAVVPLAWAGWQVYKKRLGWQKLRPALAIAAGAAALHVVYALLRLDQVTITSKIVVFSPLSLAATFLLSACGALIYFQARGRAGKVIALLVTTFISGSLMVFVLLCIAGFNLLAFQPRFGEILYNYTQVLLPAISLLFTLALAGFALWLIERRWLRQPIKADGE